MTRDRTVRWLRLAAAALGGLGVGCGFAPVDSPVLLGLGLIAFVAALQSVSLRSGAVLGAVFGACFLGLLVWWVHVLGLYVWVLLVVASALFYAVFGIAFAVVNRLPAWPLWGALLWTGMEYLRSVVPFGGFPWGRIAFGTVGTPYAPYARWIGVPALSGLAFGIAALVVWAAMHRTVGRIVLAVVLVAGVTGLGAALTTGPASAQGRLRVAIVQGNVPGTGATGMGQQREVLNNHVRETLRLAAQIRAGERARPDVVLWPENASDIDPIADPTAGSEITAAARAVGAPILVGAIMNGPTPDTARNAGIAWDPKTGPGDRYVKRHLVPYGEYVPFRGFAEKVVPIIKTEIPRDMLSGTKPGVMGLGGVDLGDMMCFDVVFDNLVHDVVTGGSKYLVVQTNNATYTDQSQPEQQWQIARMRAIEAGRYVAVPSTNGVSGLIDATGHVVQRAPTKTPAIVDRDITLASGVTPGVRFGGWIEKGAALLGLAAVVAGWSRRPRRTTARMRGWRT